MGNFKKLKFNKRVNKVKQKKLVPYSTNLAQIRKLLMSSIPPTKLTLGSAERFLF